MATRSKIGMVHPDGAIAVYCHWDGYLNHVGKTLQEHYSSTAKVAQLISLGSLSSLGATLEGGDDPTEAYHRDRGDPEDSCLPSIGPKEKVYNQEYNYHWDGTQWWVLRGTQPSEASLTSSRNSFNGSTFHHSAEDRVTSFPYLSRNIVARLQSIHEVSVSLTHSSS